MERIFLIKYGEINLKGENRSHFVKLLKINIKRKLKEIPTLLTHKPGRFYLSYNQEDGPRISRVLASTFGIVYYADAIKVEKDMDKIETAALELAEEIYKTQPGRKFRIESRRTDKKFPFGSYQISCRLGALLLSLYKDLKVNLNRPDWQIQVEIREQAYVYGADHKGLGGLPVSCAGRGLLLLSGGIDSPVAGYLMGKRGLDIDAIYFHTPPYTSDNTLAKIRELGGLLSRYFSAFKLYVVPFTEVQVRIKETARHNEVTLHSRAAMMHIASRIAAGNNHICLITGESLSQVASQTAQSIRYTQHVTDLPVFRPLCGMDKEEIVVLARKIATYEVSIQPHPDCCTLFAPAHPLIKPDFESTKEAFRALKIDSLLQRAIMETECEHV